MSSIGQEHQPDITSRGRFYDESIIPPFASGEFIGLFVVNSISILCSLFVMGFIHMYRNTISVVAATRQRGKRRTLRRPVGTRAVEYLALPASLRLLFIASIIDILYSSFRIYSLSISMSGFSGNHQNNCEASMAGVTFFNLMSVFVRALLNVHLQLVIINNTSRALVYGRHFLIGAFVVSIVFAILPIITHNYVWLTLDPTIGSSHCGYFPLRKTTDNMQDIPLAYVWTQAMARKALQKGLIIMWLTNFAWVTLTVFYGAVVIVSVVIRLAHQNTTLNRIARGQGLILKQEYQRKRQFLHTAAKVVRRILQFPLMVVVCHIFEVVYGMVTLTRALQLMRTDTLGSAATDTNTRLTRLYLTSQFMLAMEGIITLLFLPLEPPIRLMLHRQYLRWKSDLRHLGTIKKSMRPRPAENRPCARSHYPPLQPSYDDDLDLPLPWCDKTLTVCARNSSLNPNGIGHFVTKFSGSSSNNNISSPSASSASSSSPLGAANDERLQKGDSKPIQRPKPVYKSKTLDEFPWDVVAVSRQGRPSTGAPIAEVSEQDISSIALAMRNDGLLVQQWYVPESPNRKFTAADLSEFSPDLSVNNTLVTRSCSSSRHISAVEI